MDVTVELIGLLLGTGLVGALFGSWLQHELDRKLRRESAVLLEERRVFNELANSLRVFVGTTKRTSDEKGAFLSAYDAIWLWASDEVISALNRFVEIQERANRGEDVPQEQRRRAYATCVLQMRKSLGFKKTALTPDEYRFFEFDADQVPNESL